MLYLYQTILEVRTQFDTDVFWLIIFNLNTLDETNASSAATECVHVLLYHIQTLTEFPIMPSEIVSRYGICLNRQEMHRNGFRFLAALPRPIKTVAKRPSMAAHHGISMFYFEIPFSPPPIISRPNSH
jgi:hypothetical protein